jgi:hypothetical protein
LLIQDVLGEGLVELGADDERALTPLFWSNIAPYGEVKLNMRQRITLAADARRPGTGQDDPTTPA